MWCSARTGSTSPFSSGLWLQQKQLLQSGLSRRGAENRRFLNGGRTTEESKVRVVQLTSRSSYNSSSSRRSKRSSKGNSSRTKHQAAASAAGASQQQPKQRKSVPASSSCLLQQQQHVQLVTAICSDWQLQQQQSVIACINGWQQPTAATGSTSASCRTSDSHQW